MILAIVVYIQAAPSVKETTANKIDGNKSMISESNSSESSESSEESSSSSKVLSKLAFVVPAQAKVDASKPDKIMKIGEPVPML